MSDEETPETVAARAINLPPCAACGYVQDGVSPADGGPPVVPPPGAIIVCLACGAMSTVDEGGALGVYVRPLTPAEHVSAMGDPGVVRTLELRAMLEKRAGDSWPRGKR